MSYIDIKSLMCTGNYSATSNNMKLEHWPLMGGLLQLLQQGGQGARTWPQPTKAPPRQLTVPNVTVHHQQAVYQSLYCCIMVRCSAVLMSPLKG